MLGMKRNGDIQDQAPNMRQTGFKCKSFQEIKKKQTQHARPEYFKNNTLKLTAILLV